MKWYAALDSEERRYRAEQKILSLLSEDREVSWQDLVEKANKMGISKTTLSKHLKHFIESGIVFRRVDTSAYPPRTYYRKTNVPFYQKIMDIRKACERSRKWIDDALGTESEIALDVIRILLSDLECGLSACLILPREAREPILKEMVELVNYCAEKLNKLLHENRELFGSIAAEILLYIKDKGRKDAKIEEEIKKKMLSKISSTIIEDLRRNLPISLSEEEYEEITKNIINIMDEACKKGIWDLDVINERVNRFLGVFLEKKLKQSPDAPASN